MVVGVNQQTCQTADRLAPADTNAEDEQSPGRTRSSSDWLNAAAVSRVLTYLLTHLLTYLLTYLLTPCSTVLLEKLTGSQPVKKFPAFYGTRRFITAFTSARHLSLS